MNQAQFHLCETMCSIDSWQKSRRLLNEISKGKTHDDAFTVTRLVHNRFTLGFQDLLSKSYIIFDMDRNVVKTCENLSYTPLDCISNRIICVKLKTLTKIFC